MRRLLKEISVIPGVTGSCIFDKNDGALCSDFKADLPVELTESVGIHFVRLIQMGTMNKLNITSANFRFDKYSVVGLPLDTGAILLAICESDANCSLVATTATMLAEDMRDDLTTPVEESTAGKQNEESAKKVNGESSDDASTREAKQESADALKPQFEEISDALAAAIGPVAGMVMADYISKWSQSGAQETSRLGELIKMLLEEIEDAGLASEFQAKTKHLV